MNRPTRLLALPGLPAIVAVLAACGAAAPELPSPGTPPPADAYRGVPGFDTREYPGDDAMARWFEASPYRWVGFYLPAPCYTGASWQGRRAALRDAGWGLAVLFVGEQDWPERPDARAPDPDAPRCTRSNLTGERGRADATAAAAAAAADGFDAGTVIYLDVERVESVSDALREYTRAWTAGLLEDGRYVPGLYAHAANADALMATVGQAFASAGRQDRPRLWLANTTGFNIRRAPAESGFDAAVWQGRLDVDETWGGVTLRIDVNVADSPDPSRP